MKVEQAAYVSDCEEKQEQAGLQSVKQERCDEQGESCIKSEPVDVIDVREIKVEKDEHGYKVDVDVEEGDEESTQSGRHLTYLGLEASVFARQARGPDKIYRCPRCEYTTKGRSLLLRHARAMHDPSAEVLHCAFCSYTTKWRGNLVEHAQSRHLNEGTTHRCPHCAYSNRWKSRVLRHVRAKHGATLIKCGKCEYRTSREGALVHHARTKHGDQLERQCQLCDFTGRTSYELGVHARSQHEGKWHVCPHCPYRTKWKGDLGKHVRSRHSAQPSKGKTTTETEIRAGDTQTKGEEQEEKEKEEEEGKTGTRGYTCPECAFTSQWQASIHAHRRAFHQTAVPFHCPLCPFKARWRYSYTRHLARQHPDSPSPVRQSTESPKQQLLDSAAHHSSDTPNQ